MYPVFSFLHFLGMSFLVGGEPLIAMVAIKASKDDAALGFFIGFLRRIAAFMWIGTFLALLGGVGMVYMYPASAGSTAFMIKSGLVALIIVVALVMAVMVKRIEAAYSVMGVAGIRQHASYKTMDVLSRINLFAVLAIVVVSTQI